MLQEERWATPGETQRSPKPDFIIYYLLIAVFKNNDILEKKKKNSRTHLSSAEAHWTKLDGPETLPNTPIIVDASCRGVWQCFQTARKAPSVVQPGLAIVRPLSNKIFVFFKMSLFLKTAMDHLFSTSAIIFAKCCNGLGMPLYTIYTNLYVPVRRCSQRLRLKEC